MAATTMLETTQALDMLNEKLGKLDALLAMINGEGEEIFNRMNDSLRSDYIWCCSSLAAESKALTAKLNMAALVVMP